MKKLGMVLISIAAILLIYFTVSAIMADSPPNEGIFLFVLASGIIGSVLILIGVSIDRYKDYKEEKENDDYRKY